MEEQSWYEKLGYDKVIPFEPATLPMDRNGMLNMFMGAHLDLDGTQYIIAAIESFATHEIRHIVNLMLKKI